MAPALNEAKAGSAVPLGFSQEGAPGLPVMAAGNPASQAVNCDSREPAGSLQGAEPADKGGLGYDGGTGRYGMVWKTDKAWAGTCRALMIKLIDGTEHRAYFQFR